MKPLPAALEVIEPSGIRVIADLAARIPDAIHLEIGEPDFPTPPHIVQAASEAATQGYTKYTPSAGFESLRELIVDKLCQSNGIRASLNNITVTPGAICGIASCVFALAEAGEEVLVPDPGWPNYRLIVVSAGCDPISYPLHASAGFAPDPKELEQLVTARTKVLILGSPSNPSGAVFPKDIILALVELAARHDLYIVTDEVYEAFVFEGEHVSPAQFDGDGRVASVFSFSKTYAMTGWRIGYVAAADPVSSLVTKLQQAFVSCASAVSQKAAEAALAGPQGCVGAMREAYRSRRDMVVSMLQRHGLRYHVPNGAFYLMVDVSSTGRDADTFAKALLREQGVAVAPGSAFGRMGEGYVRVSLARSDADLQRGIELLCAFVRSAE
jgi:aspartate aminotransferase/aminotransferase